MAPLEDGCQASRKWAHGQVSTLVTITTFHPGEAPRFAVVWSGSGPGERELHLATNGCGEWDSVRILGLSCFRFFLAFEWSRRRRCASRTLQVQSRLRETDVAQTAKRGASKFKWLSEGTGCSTSSPSSPLHGWRRVTEEEWLDPFTPRLHQPHSNSVHECAWAMVGQLSTRTSATECSDLRDLPHVTQDPAAHESGR
ncbi:uncharacterized protein CIMG_12456 [Coccidioides immitis RS]|uniref:Uncharacterized protein n=1 Tax=Coccidioides immitis (strain RS) TaxID=246410 RepID=A0A0D8JY86_COCIM|nr:uncharacterized protein CIMG_12456 [Coccidioides immitis RS]KJF61213.1 hypothetical protein CIMG_12456 [Coccidioides immitis RS]